MSAAEAAGAAPGEEARRRIRVGVVGCGSIAGAYGFYIGETPTLELVACTDLDPTRAEAFAAEHGCRAMPDLASLLALDLDIVVNLTIPAEHHRVTRAALEAGHHVHSEKPLALRSEDAWDLVELARAKGLRLGCSPFTLMGEAQQTAWRTIRDGAVGQVRLVYAQLDWGRIETWHPAPETFYAIGPLADVGVYPLSIITGILGPVRRVHAFARTLLADRVRVDGTPFQPTTADTWIVTLELEGGAVVRLTATFYGDKQAKGHAAVAFHGDRGSVWLEDAILFDTTVEVAALGEESPHVPVPLVRPAPLIDWARAVADLGEAIATGRAHHATGEQAAHLVDVLAAARESAARDGVGVEVRSSFTPPEPMPWAADG